MGGFDGLFKELVGCYCDNRRDGFSRLACATMTGLLAIVTPGLLAWHVVTRKNSYDTD